MEAWARLASEERSEAFLVALRDSLQRQSTVPPLPPGWTSESAMIPCEGFEYGGDFFVAHLEDGVLQMVLVDACGHGPSAVPDAVEFAGALGALVLTLPPCEVMASANGYLYQRGRPDGFTTAVQVSIRLGTGECRIRSAGHPPVLRWVAASGEWVVDNARGTALGVVENPVMSNTSGVLAPGDALMFYTDGVVEARGDDIDEGIARLRSIAREAVAHGFSGAPARILADLPPGEDDRAVLILRREPDGAPVVPSPRRSP